MPVCCLEKMFITWHSMVGTKQYAKSGCELHQQPGCNDCLP